MLIVDANNVLHAAGDPHAPDALARLLAAIMPSRYRARDVILVSDASPGRLSPGARAAIMRITAQRPAWRVLHAGPDREADDVIEGILGAAPDPARITVVSSDARLARSAASVGASCIPARTFLAELEKDRTKAIARAAPADDALDPASVTWWMSYFGYAPPASRSPRTPPPTPAPRPTPTARDAPAPPPPPRHDAAWDWLAEAMRTWHGVSEPALDMERILKEQPPPRKRRKRK